MLEDFNSSGTVRSPSASAARARFPRGLFQPEGSFRFSSDALLLACFPSLDGVRSALDLGAGCGVVGLALLCRQAGLRVTGIDCQEPLTAAARRNAGMLGFERRYTAHTEDLAATDMPAGFAPGSFDLALANPPYRRPDRGRLPQSASRCIALFERAATTDTLSTPDAFCRAAALALKPGGRFCLVYPAERMAKIQAALEGRGLRLARVLPLVSKAGRSPQLLLLESVNILPAWQGAAPATDAPRNIQTPAHRPLIHRPLIHRPLTLHESGGAFSAEVRAFCPFLAKPR